MTKTKDEYVWRVVRCAYERRRQAIKALRRDGFEVHDSYQIATGVPDFEEYTIVAKKRVHAKV